MSSQKVKLEICGSSYVVSTNDSEEYLLGLAERLDRDMNQILLEASNASVTSAAVITALAYLDEAEKNAFGADNMRAQIQGYLEDASKARLAAEEAKREVTRLRNELAWFEAQKSNRAQKEAQAAQGMQASAAGDKTAEGPGVAILKDQIGLDDL